MDIVYQFPKMISWCKFVKFMPSFGRHMHVSSLPEQVGAATCIHRLSELTHAKHLHPAINTNELVPVGRETRIWELFTNAIDDRSDNCLNDPSLLLVLAFTK